MASSTTTTRSPHSPPERNDPFVSSGTSNFFQEGARGQRLDLLFSLLCYGRSPLVLIGPHGAGKTTLLWQLQQRIGALQPTALLSATPALALEPLLDEAQRQFTAVLAAGGLERSSGAVLLVDDADTLADVVLRVLITPIAGQEEQARVVLTGTPELIERLQSFTDNAIPVAKIFELLPFTEEESTHFVRTRLKAAGILTHPLLQPKALQQLYRKSAGWPGAILTHARLALAPTTIRTEQIASPSLPAAPPPAPAPPAPIPAKVPPKTVTQKKNMRPPLIRVRSTFIKSLRQAVHSYWFWPVVGVLTVVILSGLWPHEIPTVIAPLSSLQPPPALPPPISSTISVAIPPIEPPPPPVRVAPPIKQPSVATLNPVSNQAVTPPPPPLTPVALNPVLPPPPVAVTTPRSEPIPTPNTNANANANAKGLHNNDWIRAQRPKDYTLQLMSGNTEADLQEFMRRWGLNGEVAIANTQRAGQNWYALLYGIYANYNEAQDAAKKLPSGIGKPWMRNLGSVQKDLR